MSKKLILNAVSQGLARITLNRPEKANAVNSAMLGELGEIIDALCGDSNVRAVLITGAGGRVFCAGADLDELGGKTSDSQTARAFDQTWDSLAGRIASLPALTIACWNGTCAGGGLSLSLGCDLRIAAEQAQTFYPVLRNGVLPSAGDVSRFHELIGPSRTKMLLLGGHRLTANEALEWGLVDMVVPEYALEDTALQLCAAALAAPQARVNAFKKAIGVRDADHETRDLCYRAVYDHDSEATVALRGRRP